MRADTSVQYDGCFLYAFFFSAGEQIDSLLHLAVGIRQADSSAIVLARLFLATMFGSRQALSALCSRVSYRARSFNQHSLSAIYSFF
jgi:hypothetical protein